MLKMTVNIVYVHLTTMFKETSFLADCTKERQQLSAPFFTFNLQSCGTCN